MATLFVTGHSVDERTMKLEWGICMGEEVQMSGGCMCLLLCRSIYSSRSSGPIFILLRAALSMGLTSIYAAARIGERLASGARQQLSLNRLSVRSIIECTVDVVGCVDRC